MFRYALAAVATLALVASTQSASLKTGDAAPKFSGLESATSGKKVSLEDFKDKDVLVVCITCNHCPFAKAYEGRLVKFAKDFAGKDSKVALVAINANTEGEDNFDGIKDRVKEKHFNFEYLFDPSQQFVKDLGASATPEFFVFDKNRHLVYTGAMDDNGKDQAKVTKRYVEDAVKATLKGEKPETASTTAKGCKIQFNKK